MIFIATWHLHIHISLVQLLNIINTIHPLIFSGMFFAVYKSKGERRQIMISDMVLKIIWFGIPVAVIFYIMKVFEILTV